MREKSLPTGFVSLVIGILFMFGGCGWAAEQGAQEPSFVQAKPGREILFPRDHGKHPDFQTEWWYFTGNLESSGGRRWGFQLTFFRRTLMSERARSESAWGIRDIYPAHFALADIAEERFFHTEIMVREGPGLAGAADDRLDVFVRDWKAQQKGDRILVSASKNGYELNLELEPIKAPILHGKQGFSQKGNTETQASYYYSFTRLKATGSITFAGKRHDVTGLAWMDHEFGSSILLPGQSGWDWFSLQLDDGSDLMVFHLRKQDGTTEQPFGTLVTKDGKAIDLHGQEIRISPKTTWKSPHTGAQYPARWQITIPAHGIDLTVQPAMADQELGTAGSTGIVYWEGAATAQGKVLGKRVKGRGYVELTGYAESIGGRL